ncbi:thymidine phosphorylase [bacterium]|nr:thymidine phosphorylase [bacterium]MBU1652151.1 thymidine phosphorylase [bacterium]MBU1880913.1 thymidine phosphorylase [bacterium]
MNTVSLIKKKQAGNSLTSEEVAYLVSGFARAEIPDYQMAAFLMATYFQGMSRAETVELTRAMIASGDSADLSSIAGIKVDKHSTGGVGDKVSLIVAPIAAACGVPVPMISGRGLGHTGGTLDKLESIPGFSTQMSMQEFEKQVAEIGCALIGQTDRIVPADRKMYALRDVTGTVQSIPLICGSILSKKVAEGIDALVLDVKYGHGAVYQEVDGARELAHNLVEIGEGLGLQVVALLTDMNQPLGNAIGNWLEVKECLDILKGSQSSPDLLELSLIISALMLKLGGISEDDQICRQTAEKAITDGSAFDKFVQICQQQGADVSFLNDPATYPSATAQVDFAAQQSGYLSEVNALVIGQAAVELGAGRKTKEDEIDYTAGIILHKKRGGRVEKGEPLLTICAQQKSLIDAVLPELKNAFQYVDAPLQPKPLILSMIDRNGENPWI